MHLIFGFRFGLKFCKTFYNCIHFDVALQLNLIHSSMRKAGKFLQLPFYARWTDGGGQMEVDRWRWTDGGIQKGKQVWIVHMTNIIGIFSNKFF